MNQFYFALSDDYRLIAQLDAECFPIDVPAEYPTAEWTVVYDITHENPIPAAFCGWKAITWNDQTIGFLYRAGVRENFRGNYLQRKMIKYREMQIILKGLPLAVTYTDADGAYSMRNLISEHYLPYVPTDKTRLSGPAERIGRCGFVHWMKEFPKKPA